MSSSQLVSHEKLYVFDRDGYLSSPIVREIHGMTWRISFELFVPRSAPPHINIKYSCENFGDKEGCYVIMKFNSRRSAQFFQINKSVFFVRKALVGFPKGPETNTHYLNEDVVNREDLHGLTLSEWKFVDPEVKEDVPNDPDEWILHHPIIQFDSIHFPMKKISPISQIYIPTSTFASELGEIPFEFDPKFFNKDDQIADLVKGWQTKTDSELRELSDVLGYFHHETFSGMTDKRLVDTQILALEMGIFNEVPVSDMFSWEHRSPRVSSSTRPSLDFVSEKWEDSFSGPARLYDETCLLIEEGFTFNQHHMFLIMAVFKRTFNSKEFLSFGALFGMPPSEEIFHCKIRIQSPIAGIDSSVERYLKHGQNTIMIPTLFDCSELTEKLVSFNIKVQLETVSNEFHPKHVVMPGITNLTVKSKSGSFNVDKNVLIEKVDFFKTYLRNIHFGGHIKKEIRLTETEFKEFSYIVDAVYHGSKTCDVDSFVLFGTASDAFLCTELYSVWEKSALKCKTPEVRAMVIKQQKNE